MTSPIEDVGAEWCRPAAADGDDVPIAVAGTLLDTSIKLIA